MHQTKLYLHCRDVCDTEFIVDVKDMELAVEMFGNLFISGVTLKQLDGMKMTATLPLTQLQAARIVFWARTGIWVERSYISIA